MTPSVAERAFEDAIECALLAGGPDACPGGTVREIPSEYGDQLPGGYRRRHPDDYLGALDVLRHGLKARLTFDQVVTDRLQDMVDVNFKSYKRVTDDQQFSRDPAILLLALRYSLLPRFFVLALSQAASLTSESLPSARETMVSTVSASSAESRRPFLARNAYIATSAVRLLPSAKA